MGTYRSQDHLRLCHRRCYVQDFVRYKNFELTKELESPKTRREVVPTNQRMFEILSVPRFQHLLARKRLQAMANVWQVPRDDQPWPAWWAYGDRIYRRTTHEEWEKRRQQDV